MSFQVYFAELLKGGRRSGPSATEARKDFRVATAALANIFTAR